MKYSDFLEVTVRDLNQAGFEIIPLAGVDGKKPTVRFSDRHIPLKLVINQIRSGKATGYGIRLEKIIVLDIDEKNLDLIYSLEDRFGPTPYKVETKRGYHLYYRFGGKSLNLRKDGMPVDCKTGLNSFVVGPNTIRPDGTKYLLMGLPLIKDKMPELVLTKRSDNKESMVPEGRRHQYLLRQGINSVPRCESKPDLLKVLSGERDRDCVNPDDVGNQELEKIVDWVWKLHLEGKLYSAYTSEVKIPRWAIQKLQGLSHGYSAIGLMNILVSAHGHQQDRLFTLSHRAMKDTGLTHLSREAFKAAIGVLVEIGVLEVTKIYIPKRRCIQYRLKI